MQTDYFWQESYRNAFLETDHRKLPNLIQVAKAAIDDRLHELHMDHGGTPEERKLSAMRLQG